MKKYMKPKLKEETFLMLEKMLIGSETDQEVTDGGAAKLDNYYFEEDEE